MHGQTIPSPSSPPHAIAVNVKLATDDETAMGLLLVLIAVISEGSIPTVVSRTEMV